MQPNEERPAQEYWEVDDPPDPTVAQTGPEFVAELGALFRSSGLAPAEIEHRMRAYGNSVPDGVVSDTLRSNALPREELLVPMLWAVGCNDDTVELWVWTRDRLAAADAQFDPAEIHWVPDESKKFSDGALADAVQKRRNQSGWRGLHRRAVPDDGDEPKHTPKRARGKRLRPTKAGGGASWSSRAMVGLVVLGTLALVAGVAAALTDGGEAAAPPASNVVGQTCCAGSASPDAPTPDAPTPSVPPTTTTTPKASTKASVSPTPRQSTTTQSPQPSPAQTPKLSSNGNATCTPQDGNWSVSVTITATLTGATSGTDPVGQASYGGSQNSITFSGSGSTTFSGQTSFNAGVATTPVTGTISWNVTVTVPGDTASDPGEASFSCGS